LADETVDVFLSHNSQGQARRAPDRGAVEGGVQIEEPPSSPAV